MILRDRDRTRLFFSPGKYLGTRARISTKSRRNEFWKIYAVNISNKIECLEKLEDGWPEV